jgi:lipoprotein signal peptidase
MSSSEPLNVSADPITPRWAMSHLPSHLRLWTVAALGLTVDLWTKAWAFRTYAPHESRVLIEDICNLELSLNPGALFGIGAGLAPVFVGASVLALLFVLYLFANSNTSRWSMHVALGLVLAGAIGNLYDRTTQEAYVVYTPDGRRDIGVLVQDDQHANSAYITLGDFPYGGNERSWKQPIDPRSGRQPVVRDFIKIDARIGNYSLWPWVFNVADALLMIGVAVLLINFWFDHRRHQRHAAMASLHDEPATEAT